MSNVVTEQLTQAGKAIEHNSFAIVDQEAGTHEYQDSQWQIVRRMIHATADFEFNGLTQFHPESVAAGMSAISNGANIVADVEMICVGLSKPRLSYFSCTTHHYIADADVIEQAKQENTTRAVQAMRKAHALGKLDGSIVAIGNAPTALLEVIRLVREQSAKPALIIGMPVGFVSAEESKQLLSELSNNSEFKHVPWMITQGRKGGSTLVVSAIHALLALVEAQQKSA